jgi:hypothetical protein
MMAGNTTSPLVTLSRLMVRASARRNCKGGQYVPFDVRHGGGREFVRRTISGMSIRRIALYI